MTKILGLYAYSTDNADLEQVELNPEFYEVPFLPRTGTELRQHLTNMTFIAQKIWGAEAIDFAVRTSDGFQELSTFDLEPAT